MNQNLVNGGLTNPSYIPNQSTYPPYMNIPNYADSSSNTNNSNSNNTNNIQGVPQYAENLFSMNRGKKVTTYFSYPDSLEWRDSTFTGTILESGRDYLLLKDDQDQTLLLWLVYINYAVFEGEISF